MSTIAGEGTSSDGSEVTMTAPESERTDGETTGTTGQNSKRNTRLSTLLSHHFFVCCDVLVLVSLTSGFCFIMIREWDRGRERRSRGEYRDYDRGRRERFTPPRHDMSPQQKRMRRDWWDEKQWLWLVLSCFLLLKNPDLSAPGMIMVAILTAEDMTWVTAVVGAPVTALHSTGATLTCISCSLIMASPYKRGERWCDEPQNLSAMFFLFYIQKLSSFQAWQHPWHGFGSTSSNNEEL